MSGWLAARMAMRSPRPMPSCDFSARAVCVMRCARAAYVRAVSPKRIAGLSGANAALRSIRSARSTSFVLLARLVQRLAPQPVEADFGGPRQHQRAAAAVAIDALQRQTPQHGLAAAGADRLG